MGTMIDWRHCETILLDMDGTILDLAFDNYFWQFFNDGTRNIQARFYEREQFPQP